MQSPNDAVFDAFGLDASFTPDGGTSVLVRVIAKRPDTIVGFGETRVHAATASFEVRVSEVASPRPGDQLTVGGESFVVRGEPERRDPDLELGCEAGMRLSAALSSDLRKLLAEEVRAAESAVTAGVRQAGDGLKGELRRQMASAGLGGRLANAWRDRHYPNQKLDSASLVWTKAPQIIRAFDEGAVIRSNGQGASPAKYGSAPSLAVGWSVAGPWPLRKDRRRIAPSRAAGEEQQRRSLALTTRQRPGPPAAAGRGAGRGNLQPVGREPGEGYRKIFAGIRTTNRRVLHLTRTAAARAQQSAGPMAA